MDFSNLVTFALVLGIIALVAYIAMSSSPLPKRIRRIISQKRSASDEAAPPAPRPNARWGEDPDRVNEAREVERVTGVIRTGDAVTVVTNDPSHWGARSFEIQGNVTAVAEVQTLDITGNFQFRFLTVNMVASDANTIIIEGDSPAGAVVYFGRAYSSADLVDDQPAGRIISAMVEARNQYRALGNPEMVTSLPVYESGAVVAGRYDGRLAVLESEPGTGYLPLSASSGEGQAYADATVRLDGSGWNVRLVEIGAYSFLLELEPLKLTDLTIHHRA
ncbi:MAG: hypothetical protein ACKVVP_01755 [Chloroflexota bacterium]